MENIYGLKEMEGLSSNLCRCTGYEEIGKAVKRAQNIENVVE